MLNSLFKFLKGYVIIKVYGRNTERFVNICMRRGIGVRSVKRCADGSVIMRIRKCDFKNLRPIAYKTHTKVHIVSKKGFYALRKQYRHRYGLIVGAVVCTVFLVLSPLFVWKVNIYGNDDIDTQTISDSLKEIGIYRGAFKRNIPDGFSIKRHLLRTNKELIWAWAYINGTTVDVRVYEKTFPPNVVDRDEPCDIVAACDAYLEDVRVLNGKGMIKSSNAVQAGEVIVSGKVAAFKEGEAEKYRYVHARSEIKAYTERIKTGVYPLRYENRIPTGRSKSFIYVDLFGKRINLYRDENCDWTEYDKEEFSYDFFGIAVGGVRCNEVTVEYEPMSIDGALQIAKEDLECKIAKELCKNAVLSDEDLQYEKISDEEVKVRLKMSFTEDIGVEIPIEIMEETVIDKQEN